MSRLAGEVTRLLLAGLGAEVITTWGPAIEALAVLGVVVLLLVVTLIPSDTPFERLITLIRALRR